MLTKYFSKLKWVIQFIKTKTSCTRFHLFDCGLCLLYSHDQLYKHIIHLHLHMLAEHNDTIKTSDTVLRKIYLSFYLKGLCMRGSWRPNRTATYWPPTLMALSVSFPFSWACSTGGLGDQPLWVLVLSTTSYLQLVWSPNGLNFLCTELYNSSTSTFFLWESQFRTHSTCPRSRL